MRASYSSTGTDNLFNTEPNRLLVRASYSSIGTDNLFSTERNRLLARAAFQLGGGGGEQAE